MKSFANPRYFSIHGSNKEDCSESTLSGWQSHHRWLQNNRKADHESGESTGTRIVILRKSPNSQEQNPTFGRFVGSKISCTPHSSQIKRRKVGKVFRVPSGKVESKSKTKGGLCINSWKEYLLGTSVLNPEIISFDRHENGCDTWYKLWCAYKEIISSCSYYGMWIKRLFLYIVRIFLPMGGKFYFFYFRHYHISIHKKGMEQSLDIKFHGSPFQGMSLYFARINCPFCAEESQQMLMMKYFQSTVTERRYMMRHKLHT